MTKVETIKKRVSFPTVIGTGLFALDIIISLESPENPLYYAGGTCGNILLILSYMGWQSHPIARLNGDLASKQIIKDFQKWGLNLKYSQCEPQCSTPLIIQETTKNKQGQGKHRFHFRCPNCGAFFPRYKPVLTKSVKNILPSIKSPSVFFFDRVSSSSLLLAETFVKNGTLIVFEPSGIGDLKLFNKAINIAHVLKYSSERITGVWDHCSAKTNIKLEIETLGSYGLRFRTSFKNKTPWHHLDSYSVNKVLDTAGSGDWCTASLINILGQNGYEGFINKNSKDIAEALKYGQAAAAWNCNYLGARGGMYSTRYDVFDNLVHRIIKGESVQSESQQQNCNHKMVKCFSNKLCPICK